jgi:hypothetical protein
MIIDLRIFIIDTSWVLGISPISVLPNRAERIPLPGERSQTDAPSPTPSPVKGEGFSKKCIRPQKEERIWGRSYFLEIPLSLDGRGRRKRVKRK